VELVDDLEHFDVKENGAAIRYGLYGKEGSNINFVKQIDEHFSVLL
jgi:diaminopimelate epimerase